MSEPRAVITPEQIRTARARVALSGLVSQRVKLIKRGREFLGLCPFHKERTPSFRVDDGKGLYHCFGCGAGGDVIAWRMFWARESFAEAVLGLCGDLPLVSLREIEARDSERDHQAARRALTMTELAREIWSQARPIAGTPGDGYYRARGIDPAALPLRTYPPTLRYHPHVLHGPRRGGLWLPAWIAAVQDHDGRVVAIHRGYLDPASFNGTPRKTPHQPDKALLGSPAGGAVRLTPWSPAIGTCEGIETGLSILQAMPERRLWAGIDGAHMGLVDWPEDTEELTIFADRDRADIRRYLEIERADGSTYRRRNPNFMKRPGEGFARRAAEKFLEARRGRCALMVLPPGEKADFNDMLLR